MHNTLLRGPVEPKQYVSEDYTQQLDDAKVLASVGSVGDCYDNALAESFVDSYKTELIADRVWRSHAQLELATVDYVAWFNTRRLHSSLGNRPPVEHEQRHVAALAANPEALLLPTGSVTLNRSGVYDPCGVVSDLRDQTITLTR
jgi:putative transposase